MTSLSPFIHRKIIVLKQDVSVFQAARAICVNQVGALLVGDAEGGATGIVTDRDIACRWGALHGGWDIPLEKIMSRDLVVADEDSGLTRVMELMERYGLRRIPIVRSRSDGKRTFVGIVTLDDLIASRQVTPNQLSRIVRRQVGRRIDSLFVHRPATARVLARSEARKKQTADEFFHYVAKETGMPADIVPQVTQFILGALVMRVTYTTASHLMAQVPDRIRESLLKLPPGPDREFSVDRILHELSSRFHVKHEEALTLLQKFLAALQKSKEGQAFEHLEAQLPQDFWPYLERGCSVEPAQAKEPDPHPLSWQSPMSFVSRTEAADLLASRLESYVGEHPLVLGIPRGSVPMARVVAARLKCDLDVVLVHKIGAPGNPEFAIGSVSEFGDIYRSEALGYFEISPEYIEAAAKDEIERLKKRRKSYSPVRPPISPMGRTVIIVDDGIATGSTMLAAIRAIRAQKPKRLVVAAPVASPRTIDSLKQEADDVVVLETPEEFFSISQFYDDFPQIEDEEVLQALSEAGEPKKRRHGEAA
jgi:putative phosphoribosyl transferase